MLDVKGPASGRDPIEADIDSGARREIIRRIRQKGPITFAEFMEVALYWPDGGYYTSGALKWGAAGDYITSLDVSPVFSKVIARQVCECWELLGSPSSFRLVEPGAGRGWLSKGIFEALKEVSPALHSVIRIDLVEKNPALREAEKGRVAWHEDLFSLGSFTGVILSNELIDSFPVHRVENRQGLKELYTGFDGDSFIDSPGAPSTDAIGHYFNEAGVTLAEGQRTEVNLLAKNWITNAASMLERGFVITIDYGLPARELYAPERSGTLMCHSCHKVNDDPYKKIGLQDITTHVDFTSFHRAGLRAGLELSGFTTQKNFLLGLGIAEELMEAAGEAGDYKKIKHNQGIKGLIMPGGMGDTFKVMIQQKGVEKVPLKGFSFRDMSSYL